MPPKSATFSPWVLLAVFVASVTLMGVYEAIKEFYFQGTLTHWESHTITIIVTSVIATVAAATIRSWAFNVHLKERDVEIKAQSLASFELILSAVNHIVNNVLNYLQLVKLDVENGREVNKETLQLLDESIREAQQQMSILNRIQAPYDPESYRGIYPPCESP